MTDRQLNISEDAIYNLSEALGESEKRIIDLFQLGCEIEFGGNYQVNINIFLMN